LLERAWGFKSLRPHDDVSAVGRHALAVALLIGIALCAKAGTAHTRAATSLSANWSGYLAAGGPFSVTDATFNVPNLTAAPSTTSTSEWVGIDGTNPKDRSLIQAGVSETYDPHANLVRFHAWWEIMPALETIVPLPVDAGDRISVSIGRLSSGTWRIAIRNVTRHRAFTTTQPYSGPGRTADWIVEAPSDPRGRIKTLGHYVPDVTFSNVHLGGHRGALQPQSMVQNGKVVSEVSRVRANGFSVGYRG
jgi:peptidase A4-like protein